LSRTNQGSLKKEKRKGIVPKNFLPFRRKDYYVCTEGVNDRRVGVSWEA